MVLPFNRGLTLGNDGTSSQLGVLVAGLGVREVPVAGTAGMDDLRCERSRLFAVIS